MGKTLLYIVLLLVLGFGVYYFVFRDKDAFGYGETAFQVKDTSKVGKIFLADKKGNTILAERKDGVWMVNNKYVADDGTVNSLLETISRQTAAYPVPKVAYDAVIREMAGNSIKVEVYDRKGEKITVFYVGGQVAGATKGSHMMMEASDQPYVVNIPGFEGYLSSRYTTNMGKWRDRVVFNVPQSRLKEVKMEYHEEPLNNFTMQHLGEGKFTITIDPSLSKMQNLNLRRANVYSKYFENLYCEGFLEGVPGMDTMIAPERKMVTVTVTSTDNKARLLDVYWMPINRRSKNMLSPAPGIPVQYDADRFYGVMNNYKDTVIIQRYSFEKIFRKGYEFYMPDEDQSQKFEVPKDAGNVVPIPDKK